MSNERTEMDEAVDGTAEEAPAQASAAAEAPDEEVEQPEPPLLKVRGLTRTFGGFKALDNLDLEVKRGEIVGLVGPNGSGKTTCINAISGVYRPNSGQVMFNGQDVTGYASHKLAQLGLNRTFQVPKPFKQLTVRDNIRVARVSTADRQARSRRHDQARSRDEAGPASHPLDDPIAFVGLEKLANRQVAALNSTQQKLVDLARALATRPHLVLVDELAAGLSPSGMEDIARLLRQLPSYGISLLVVEHLMGFVDSLTQHVLVMNSGKQLFEGTLSAAADDPDVQRVYLGR